MNLSYLYDPVQGGSVMGARSTSTPSRRTASKAGAAPVSGRPMPRKTGLAGSGGGGAWIKDASTAVKAANLAHKGYGVVQAAQAAQAAAPVMRRSCTGLLQRRVWRPSQPN